MTSIVYKKNDQNQTVISSHEYGYDNAGQRKWLKRLNGNGDVYDYDATGQLTNVLYEATNPDTTTPGGVTNQTRFRYDKAGNRISVVVSNSTGTTTTSYTTNGLNQYTAVGSTTPTYDNNGNLTYDGTWTYTYDRENRLIQAAKSGTTVTYTYDAFNRLIERAVGPSSKTRFYYDNHWRVIAEYDEGDNLKAKYVYGPEIDEPVRMNRNGNNYYYHAAALGTVTEITAQNGGVLERYAYDVYGSPLIWGAFGNLLSSSFVGNRLMFQGRDRDPDTRLYNFRNRYYSPSLGRFLQVDPIRQMGGLNLYRFVLNAPTLRTDGYGICPPGSLPGEEEEETSPPAEGASPPNAGPDGLGPPPTLTLGPSSSPSPPPPGTWAPSLGPIPPLFSEKKDPGGDSEWRKPNGPPKAPTPNGMYSFLKGNYNTGTDVLNLSGSAGVTWSPSPNWSISASGNASGTPNGSGPVNWGGNLSITRKF